jgi:PAS domain S-box-containing protein
LKQNTKACSFISNTANVIAAKLSILNIETLSGTSRPDNAIVRVLTKIEAPLSVEKQNKYHFLKDGSKMSGLFIKKDWSKTALGELESWPQSLKTAVGIMLNSRLPMFISWGPQRIFLYNDSYSEILGKKHPASLGERFENIWSEIWHDIEPLILAVDNGEAKYLEDMKLIMNRHGYNEETYFTFSYSPIYDESDSVTGLFCACVETTSRKKSEQELKNSEANLKTALAAAQMGTWTINLETNQVSASPELNRILGLASYKEDVVKSIEDVIHPDDRERTLTAYLHALKKNIPYENEYRIIRPDGEVRWIFSRGHAIYDQAGKAVVISGVTIDINDRKMQAETEKETLESLKNLADAIPHFVWITNEVGESIYFNQKWVEFTGAKVEERKTWNNVVHPDDTTPSRIAWENAVRTGTPYNLDYRLRNYKTGEYHWFRVYGVPYRDKTGKIVRWYGTCTDINDTRIYEDKLRESERKLDQIFMESPATLALLMGPDHVYEKVNKKFLEYSGLKESQVLKKSVNQLYPGESNNYFKDLLDKVYETGVPHRGTEVAIQKKNPDGTSETRHLDFFYQPLFNSAGQIYGIVSQASDVTDKVRAKQELEKAKDEAERASRIKSAFLANMSHEIRTPLGAMIGFADLLRDPHVSSEDRNHYLEIMMRNGNQLSVIINDILDLSKVEAGHMNFEYLESDPDEIASDVVSLLNVKAKEKNIKLHYQPDYSLPGLVVTDAVRVKQVLLNLVTNAIKFTEKGTVNIKAYSKRNTTGSPQIHFEIQDTGIGIAENQLEKIFDVFVQADDSVTRRFGGTGLGLALSRRLARALGGDVTILQSKEGQGTTFLFTFEDQPSLRSREVDSKLKYDEPVELREDSLEGVKVLIVDDAPDNQHLIGRYLKKRGATIDSAENGAEGTKKALTGAFDVVLMDIQMPVMDGYTATETLRSAGYKKPIVALTAHAMSEVRAKCLDVGCNDQLTKPINQKDLISLIVNLVHH